MTIISHPTKSYINISNLFSDDKVNTGRQVELDITKTLSFIFMIILATAVVLGYKKLRPSKG